MAPDNKNERRTIEFRANGMPRMTFKYALRVSRFFSLASGDEL